MPCERRTSQILIAASRISLSSSDQENGGGGCRRASLWFNGEIDAHAPWKDEWTQQKEVSANAGMLYMDHDGQWSRT